VDERGNKEENKALKFAETSGVKIIATIHGSDIGDARDKLGEDVYNMFENKIVIKGIGEYICY
jgi:stage III sporulation protein SpoIIIAA